MNKDFLITEGRTSPAKGDGGGGSVKGVFIFQPEDRARFTKAQKAVRGGARDGGRTRAEYHFDRLMDAIATQPPPPCEGCIWRKKCAVQDKACEQFWRYVHGHEPSTERTAYKPQRRLYDKLFSSVAVE